MDTVLFYAAVIATLFAAPWLMNRLVWQPRLRREAEGAPRITLAEAQSFWNAIEECALPIAKAIVQSRPPSSPQESRIGGAPLAIGQDTSWPRNPHNDFPMAFVAQVNFSELPRLEGFPTRGVLQIFSSFEMIDDTGECDRVIRWEPDPQTDQLLVVPDEIQKTTRQTRDFSEKARRVGLPLIFEPDVAPGNPYNWPFEESDPSMENRLPESEEVAAFMDNWEARTEQIVNGYGDHWVGGHPRFVQQDVRASCPECQNLNRILFHMGCDDEINLGDGGELNVMISREALLQRDFQKAYLTWDCA
ncbi:YwqG family protein [Marivita hallyeonensis]|uniref:Uncharacterized protein YwqG n=1 Tax=Marivita hallyeonensis TaxID=996342 RepID=A0A1M5WCP7_9RHOB|nr:YwqG family protein [Marivita hallyeonensis]SHH84983.1 Uncharacterized protein YwqG [Marivita hallyeonensis]